jgi:hypothetical protein
MNDVNLDLEDEGEDKCIFTNSCLSRFFQSLAPILSKEIFEPLSIGVWIFEDFFLRFFFIQIPIHDIFQWYYHWDFVLNNLSIYLSTYLSIYLSAYLPTYKPMYPIGSKISVIISLKYVIDSQIQIWYDYLSLVTHLHLWTKNAHK